MKNIICLGLLLSILSFNTVSGEEIFTVTLQDGLNGYSGTRDNSIFEDAQNNSQGAHPFIYVGGTAFSFRRGLIEFDLTGIPPNATVTTVSLEITVDRSGPNSSDLDIFAIHRLTNDWGEGNINGAEGFGSTAGDGDATYLANFFNTSEWDTRGGDFISTPSAEAPCEFIPGQFTTFQDQQMLMDVQDWVLRPGENFGWIILGDEQGSRTARRFDSRESNQNERPRLNLTYRVPDKAEYFHLF